MTCCGIGVKFGITSAACSATPSLQSVGRRQEHHCVKYVSALCKVNVIMREAGSVN